jgi:hypothetical protein
MLVAGSLYLTYVFSYLYLWTVSPEVWPVAQAAAGLPEWTWSIASAALLAASGAGVLAASRALSGSGRPGAGFAVLRRRRVFPWQPRSRDTGCQACAPLPAATVPWSTWRPSCRSSWWRLL